MNLKTKLLASLLLATSATAAQAQTYNVAAEFEERMTSINTFFNGSFDWDGSSVTNLHGTMNSSMYLVDNINPDYFERFPLMNLGYQLDGTQISGATVTASVFLKDTTDVYSGGGYDGLPSEFLKYGANGGTITETPNENAFFTLAFDMTTMQGVVNQMVYGDCTAGGLMGDFCMAGEKTGTSPMHAFPLSLNIRPAIGPIDAAPVPVPAAVWLFGSALTGLIGFSRRKQTLTA